MGTSAAAVSSNGIQPRIRGTLALNPTHRLAADLLAEASLTIDQVAEQAGVTRWTLWAWRQRPEFCRLVAERTEYHQTEVLSYGIAVRHVRIRTYNQIWDRLHRIIEERAASAPVDVPGARTGLLTRRLRSIGEGARAQLVEDWQFDAAVLRELRALGELAAKELGQWGERSEGDVPREVEASALTTAELLERAKQILEARGYVVTDPADMPQDVEGNGGHTPPPVVSP
jgi:hypothetical protein